MRAVTFDRSEWRREFRSKTIAMGPPLFVPGSDRFSAWAFKGSGSRGGRDAPLSNVLAAVTASATVEVETYVDPSDVSSRALVGVLFGASVPEDVHLPFTITVSEHALDVRMTTGIATLRALECGGSFWIAHGQWRDRGLVVRAWGLPPQELQIAEIDEVDELAPDRWGSA
jgi:hypothetical protein